jgi:hypothetical protein
MNRKLRYCNNGGLCHADVCCVMLQNAGATNSPAPPKPSPEPSPLKPDTTAVEVTEQPQPTPESEFFVGFSRQLVEEVISASG